MSRKKRIKWLLVLLLKGVRFKLDDWQGKKSKSCEWSN